MRYFSRLGGETYGYDDTQADLIAAATDAGWTEVTASWPPAPPPPTADQVLAGKIAVGITIAGNADLSGTYALDAVSSAQIFQIGLYANQFGVFPSGGTSQPYPDAAGMPHNFTVGQFVAFLRSVAPLVSALTTQAAVVAHGGTPAWPSQTATIA